MSKRNKRSFSANAVVTGAGSGIGRAFALELAKRGSRVVCSDIDLASCEQTAGQINANGGEAWALRCDVRQLESVQAMADTAERCFGKPVDLVINNAGIGSGGKPIGETSIEDWRATIDVNLWGVIHGCHVFAPRLKALGHGGIINVGSTASFAAAPLMSAYNVTKAGVLALTETLAAELAGSGVHCSALCPTFVKTNIANSGHIEGDSHSYVTKIIEKTGRSPDSIAIEALNALDKDQLYLMPQLEAKLIWRLKRLAPVSYNRGTKLLGRLAGSRLKPKAERSSVASQPAANDSVINEAEKIARSA